MLVLENWKITAGLPLGNDFASGVERLRWQDHASPLSVWRVIGPTSAFFRLRMSSDIAVDVMPNGEIVTHAAGGLEQLTLDHFLADQVIPRCTALSAELVIHAGAVQIADQAFLLMGNSGRGKSTLVASFQQAGHGLMGDDAMVIQGLDTIPEARSVYPSLRLFPDSVNAVLPKAVLANPVASYSTKKRIDVKDISTDEKPAFAVQAIFSIAPESNGQINLRKLSVREACMSILESSFALDPADFGEARRRLENSGKLAGKVPAFEISYPRDYARLPEVRQVILDEVASQESK